ncbi:MAG: DNA-binding response regulator, partial [Chloroflexi bacterium]
VSRSEIMQAIWETSYMEDTRTLDVHIRWLRERIEPDPSNPVYLVTVRGQGYRLNVSV